jgi:hypothetical protein
MASIINYIQKRATLFGLKSKTNTTIAVSSPVTKSEDYNRYHIYMVCYGKIEQKVFTSSTLEEAKALIQYERGEDKENENGYAMYDAYWGNLFKWIVKDTKDTMNYTYNTTSHSLELTMM